MEWAQFDRESAAKLTKHWIAYFGAIALPSQHN
jgi:hypothetical protein